MPKKDVLFICTGNICRSPMAAAFLRQDKPEDFTDVIESAGTHGIDRQPAHPLVLEIMGERGIDLSHHRARSVTPNLLMKFELILTMELKHQEWIVKRMPRLHSRVHLLGRWRELEILDPIAGDRSEFQRAADEIERCLADWRRLGDRDASTGTP